MIGLNVTCQYCQRPAQFIDSSKIYGKSYGMFYYCEPCKAYVGVHKGTNRPLGVLANAELRKWKNEAHRHFDRIWMSKIMSRHGAYKWLSEQLNKPPKLTHIGMFDIDDCKAAIEAVKRFYSEMGK